LVPLVITPPVYACVMGVQTFLAKGHTGYCGLVRGPHVDN